MYELAGELRELIKHFKNQRLRTTVERLAEWMLRSDQDAGGTGHFVIPYGKRVLASHLGMAPENLSRNLASLAPLGVAVRGRHVSLSDRAALAQFARLEVYPARYAIATDIPVMIERSKTGRGRTRNDSAGSAPSWRDWPGRSPSTLRSGMPRKAVLDDPGQYLRAREGECERNSRSGKPAHYVPVRGIAIPTADAFETPLGRLPVDHDALDAITDLSFVISADGPHAPEHALEVELPFLQTLLSAFAVVPLLVGDAAPKNVADVLRRLWGGPETLIVLSSDLSHYHDYDPRGVSMLQPLTRSVP
jgi:hypothetical protein